QNADCAAGRPKNGLVQPRVAARLSQATLSRTVRAPALPFLCRARATPTCAAPAESLGLAGPPRQTRRQPTPGFPREHRRFRDNNARRRDPVGSPVRVSNDESLRNRCAGRRRAGRVRVPVRQNGALIARRSPDVTWLAPAGDSLATHGPTTNERRRCSR